MAEPIQKATRLRVTLKDIARELNLSHATVSRALNRVDDDFISEATKERVREAASRLGYRPNRVGRSLVTGRTGLLALWLWSNGYQSSYQALISRHFYSEAQRRSYQLIVDLVGEAEVAAPTNKAFDPFNVDGLIAHESAPAIRAELGDVSRSSVPIVSTGSFQLLDGVDHVQIEIGEGAREAVRHLLQIGRREIVYVTEDLKGRINDPRYHAYVDLMSEAGLPRAFADLSSNRAVVRKGIRDYIAANGCPDALYCHNDDMAIAAYRALCDLGIKVPDDVAITGCDGIEDTEYLEVPITTIVLPLAEMCRAACEFLERRIEDPDSPLQELSLKAHLLVRPSTVGSRERSQDSHAQ